jgi:glycosyltransferase involved in cell wall biosynthesis
LPRPSAFSEVQLSDTNQSAIDNCNRRGVGPSWAINGRFLSQRMTGVQRYASEIVAALDDLLVQNRDAAAGVAMRLVVPPGTDARPSLLKIGICKTSFGSGHGWDQFILPFYARTGLLSLCNFGPVVAPKHIVCIHDANTFILPESYSRSFSLAYRALLPWVGRRARRIATVSRFSADMLVNYGVCRRDKIFIVPNGHEHALRWDAKRARLPLIDQLKRPYVLLLGSNAKHKNVNIVLAQAQALDEAGIDVVIAGGASSIFAAIGPVADRSNIHHAGYVGDDGLAALYENALCLVFPSKTEGFGIPLLEAMTKGCPAISSNAASLVEVGGDAVIYVDPDDGPGWREAIVGLSANENLRATLVAKGRERAGLFSWKRSAEVYLDEILRLQ